MSGQPLPTGKLPPELLRELLEKNTPLPPEVRLGPALGEDACAIDLPGGALVAATDPITLTGSGVGAHAVIVNANDVAVCGVRPRWFLSTVLLPEGTTDDDVRALFRETLRALREVGAHLVGGHTEVTSAVTQPVVVGQMLGLAEDGRIVCTRGSKPGDRIVQVGPAPLEGAALLATALPERLGGLAPELVAAARGALEDPGICIVEPALEATELGARALHDPTEGGIASGLEELALAGGVAIEIDVPALLWFEPGCRVCEAVGADPWGTLASGTLLAAFAAERSAEACEALAGRGWPVREIGRVVAGEGVRAADGRPLPHFARDEVARVFAEDQ